MDWLATIVIIIVLVVIMRKRYNEMRIQQALSSINRSGVPQSVGSSKDSAVESFISNERFKSSLADLHKQMNSLKNLRLRHTSYMLKYIKKEREYNIMGYVSIYTRIDKVYPWLLRKLRNGEINTADERIAVEDEIIRNISELSVEEFREKFDPDFLFDYLEPYGGDWADDSYELNFEIQVFMPEGSLTPYEMYKEYEKALYKMEQQPANNEKG